MVARNDSDKEMSEEEKAENNRSLNGQGMPTASYMSSSIEKLVSKK